MGGRLDQEKRTVGRTLGRSAVRRTARIIRETRCAGPSSGSRRSPAAHRDGAHSRVGIAHQHSMKPETVLARLLLASAFLVVGGYRLWLAYRGAPLSNGTLVLSAAEVGLGLAIARRTVLDHAGSISFEQGSPGTGVVWTLPRGPGEEGA